MNARTVVYNNNASPAHDELGMCSPDLSTAVLPAAKLLGAGLVTHARLFGGMQRTFVVPSNANNMTDVRGTTCKERGDLVGGARGGALDV